MNPTDDRIDADAEPQGNEKQDGFDDNEMIRLQTERDDLYNKLARAQAGGRPQLWILNPADKQAATVGNGITIGLEAVPPGWQAPRPSLWWLHVKGWQMVPGEYVKMIYYGLRFGN